MRSRFLILGCLLSLTACAADTEPYDPDFDPESAVSGGKADGIFDIIPTIAMDETVTGALDADDIDFYRIDLRRTDEVQISMTATSGSLNPHVSFYFGTSTYVRSDDFVLDGDTVRKTYTADSAGTYLIAARVYRQVGMGEYSLNITCNDGPCAGVFPPAESELEEDDVTECISDAQQCAFAALPAYNGRVAEARARLIFQRCLQDASTESGESCVDACEWVDSYDDELEAAPVCEVIISNLPFYADQDAACHAELDSCFYECEDSAWDEEGLEVLHTCWDSPLNSDCNYYARETTACGGKIAPDTSGECELRCLSTTGAFVDDTSDICGGDAGCQYEDLCEEDIRLAGLECGGVSSEHEDCLLTYLEDNYAYGCEDQLLEGF